MPNSDFEKEMIEFKASTLTGLEGICKDIKEMGKERKEHTKEFWTRFNSSINALHLEREARIIGDNKCLSEIKVIKAIAGFVTIVAGACAAIIAYFKN